MTESSAPPRTSGAANFLPVLIVSCAVLMLSFGLRASYGVFQLPMLQTFSETWLRNDFANAVALQNLAWGLFQPIFAMIAEKIGDRKALTLGALIYAGGLAVSAGAASPMLFSLSSGWLVGAGIAGTGFGVLLAVVGRAAPAHRRGLALGLATAAASAGQVVVPPLANALIGAYGWGATFQIFAVAALCVLAALPFLRTPPPPQRVAGEETMGALLRRVSGDADYILLFLGFFACGFQLAFITVHFPAYVTENCAGLSPGDAAALGALAISLIGVANIAGSIIAGQLGQRFTKKYLLSGIYTARVLVAVAFLSVPVTPVSVVLFSVSMGFLWLATVPLTTGLIAQIYGLRYMGTLYGFVFLSHQIGGYLGVKLGGVFYDWYGNYDAVWWIAIGVGAFSAIAHLPIRENSRLAAA